MPTTLRDPSSQDYCRTFCFDLAQHIEIREAANRQMKVVVQVISLFVFTSYVAKFNATSLLRNAMILVYTNLNSKQPSAFAESG